MKTVIVEGDHVGQRLDVLVAGIWTEKTRAQWQRSIDVGAVTVGDASANASYRLKEGDTVTYSADLDSSYGSDLDSAAGSGQGPSPKIEIIYRDSNVIVINKPAGISVHHGDKPTGGPTVASVFASQLYHDDSGRAGIVHRLDKETSGVMILARNPESLAYLQDQFRRRSVEKVYGALAWGSMKQSRARIELPLARHHSQPTKMSVAPDGKMAITEYEVTEEIGGYSLLKVRLLTGRMHQIRVHLSYLGHPVVGDSVYGKRPIPAGLSRQFLHAGSLTLELPGGGGVKTFEADLPSDLLNFQKLIKAQ